MARILLLALILLVPAGPLFADTEAERPEECPRESYWGPMPERADSTSRVFAAPETPLWARAANAPYDVLQLPVHLMNEGAKRAVIFADERDLWSRAVEPVIFPSVGPLRGRVGVSYDETSGPGGGLTVVHPSFFGRGALKVGLRATFQGSNKATAGVRFGRRGSDVLEIGGGWRKHPAAEFYGLGPASRDSDESEYTREIAWGGASLTRPILFGIEVEGSAFYSSVGSRGPGGEDEIEEEEDTPLALRFAGRLPAGYGRRSEGITGGIALVHDDTEESARPVRGGVRRASAAYFRSVDGRDADHWTWRFEVQQFLPLWYTKRALALRGVLSGIESAGDEPVPFDRLLVNDGPDLLRGF